MSKRIEIWFGGIGGQGVVYAANLLGQMASHEYQYVSSAAHYGPESRGSLTSAEIVLVSDNSAIRNPQSALPYPYTESPDIFVAMHQKAYDSIIHRKDVKKGGIIYDSTLVTKATDGVGVPATKLAQDHFKNTQMANLILLGLLIKNHKAVSLESLTKAIAENKLPPVTQDAVKLGLAQ